MKSLALASLFALAFAAFGCGAIQASALQGADRSGTDASMQSGASDPAGLRTIRPIFPHGENSENDLLRIVPAIIIAILIAAAAIFFKRKPRRSLKTVEAPASNLSLEEKIQIVAADFQNHRRSLKDFCAVVSQLLRERIEIRWNFPATCRTTEEIERRLGGVAGCQAVVRFLETADLAKFSTNFPISADPLSAAAEAAVAVEAVGIRSTDEPIPEQNFQDLD